MLGPVRHAMSQAWVRARVSRLLGADVWARLLQARSYAELGMLLGETAYGELLANVEPAMGERNLRAQMAVATRATASCLQGRAKEMVAWHGRRFEIENLKTIIRGLHYSLGRDRIIAVVLPLPSPTLPWESLLEAPSIPALVDRLRATPYSRPLEHALERYGQEGLPFFLEIAVDLFYYRRLVRLIAGLGGKDRVQAQRFLGRWIAVQNVLWAYRFKIHAGMTAEEIVSYTLHHAFEAGIDTVRRIALGAPLQMEAQRLGFGLPGEASGPEALTRLEGLAAREVYRLARATLAGPIFHLGGVLAYLVLLESEVRDLTVLIEGTLLGVPTQQLKESLLRGVT